MTLNAVNGAPQATYSPPYCKLSQRSKESATTFGRPLLTSCAKKRGLMLPASDVIPCSSPFRLARSYVGGFAMLLSERR